MELHTAVSLTGALALWVSVVLSLGGLGLTLRALEARLGRLSLTEYRGLYEHSPALAVCFLLTGLASVGFPGTMGFVAAEMLVTGAVEASPVVGVVAIVAGGAERDRDPAGVPAAVHRAAVHDARCRWRSPAASGSRCSRWPR